MALSNYILQTLICTTLFYRFGLFMKFDRLTLLAFVIPVWIVNVVFSVVWLRFFRQGAGMGMATVNRPCFGRVIA